MRICRQQLVFLNIDRQTVCYKKLSVILKNNEIYYPDVLTALVQVRLWNAPGIINDVCII